MKIHEEHEGLREWEPFVVFSTGYELGDGNCWNTDATEATDATETATAFFWGVARETLRRDATKALLLTFPWLPWLPCVSVFSRRSTRRSIGAIR